MKSESSLNMIWMGKYSQCKSNGLMAAPFMWIGFSMFGWLLLNQAVRAFVTCVEFRAGKCLCTMDFRQSEKGVSGSVMARNDRLNIKNRKSFNSLKPTKTAREHRAYSRRRFQCFLLGERLISHQFKTNTANRPGNRCKQGISKVCC